VRHTPNYTAGTARVPTRGRHVLEQDRGLSDRGRTGVSARLSHDARGAAHGQESTVVALNTVGHSPKRLHDSVTVPVMRLQGNATVVSWRGRCAQKGGVAPERAE